MVLHLRKAWCYINTMGYYCGRALGHPVGALCLVHLMAVKTSWQSQYGANHY